MISNKGTRPAPNDLPRNPGAVLTASLLVCALLACGFLATGCQIVIGPIIGTECTGDTELECGIGAFCLFEDGTCDDADRTGICTETPDACAEIFEPVCGCDGETYGNRCAAEAAGVSVDHEGEC